jgi:hypothetical protein
MTNVVDIKQFKTHKNVVTPKPKEFVFGCRYQLDGVELELEIVATSYMDAQIKLKAIRETALVKVKKREI